MASKSQCFNKKKMCVQKVQAKKFVKSKTNFVNCIFDSFKLFPRSKIDFWPFLKLQKMHFVQKKIS